MMHQPSRGASIGRGGLGLEDGRGPWTVDGKERSAEWNRDPIPLLCTPPPRQARIIRTGTDRNQGRQTDGPGCDAGGTYPSSQKCAPCYSMKINLKHGDKLPFCGERGRMLRPHRDARDARAVGRAGPWLRRLRRSHKDGYVPCRWCPGGSGISDGPGLLSGGHLGQRLMLHDSIVVGRRSGINLWGE
jgi:hypothetical protein